MKLIKWVLTKYYEFKYRKHNDNTCCCGSELDQGCRDGYCRSAFEYAVTSAVEGIIK